MIYKIVYVRYQRYQDTTLCGTTLPTILNDEFCYSIYDEVFLKVQQYTTIIIYEILISIEDAPLNTPLL